MRDQIRGAASMMRLLLGTPGLDDHTRRILRTRAAADLRAARLVRDLAGPVQPSGHPCAGCELFRLVALAMGGTVLVDSATEH